YSTNIQNHDHLSAYLSLITPKEAIGSLAVFDEFNEMNYRKFLSMSINVEEMAGLGSKSFPGSFLNPNKISTNLPKEVLNLLVEYYCV
ncbi:20497_t:CDS:1, partial [Funneliformis geosporum]